MYKPTRPERLYVDFDGFFASCEEQADPRQFGHPVGVIPFRDACNSCVIAANSKAKRFGVKTGIAIAEARRLCPRIALVPQRPDLYVRTQQRIVVAVLSVLPIDAVCSIDELVASIEDRDSPVSIAQQVKRRVRDAVGDRITCSIGCAPNRWLAKIAADLDKPNGLTVLSPSELPGRLLGLDIEELPGVGKRMRDRLKQAGLTSIEELWQAEPGWLRSVWGSVAGARLWYALHGYAVEAPSTRRSSIGHGRVLPPGQRSIEAARPLARQLTVKAARRVRRSGLVARRLWLGIECLDAPPWSSAEPLAQANDDLACLGVLGALWARLAAARGGATLFHMTVSIDRLSPARARQLEMFDTGDRRGATLSSAVDAINRRYCRTVVGYGNCGSAGGYTGAKIAYGRIPELEDFQ